MSGDKMSLSLLILLYFFPSKLMMVVLYKQVFSRDRIGLEFQKRLEPSDIQGWARMLK